MTRSHRAIFSLAVMLGQCAFGVSRARRNDTHSRNATPDYARVFDQDRVGDDPDSHRGERLAGDGSPTCRR